MKVREIMTRDVKCCGFDTNLAAASELMWSHDCGVLPVLDDGKLAGILTDRDICIAVGTRGRTAAEITAGEVATRDVQTCAPDASIRSAMATMRQAKVRRLPVVENGTVTGILALNDIINEAVDRKPSGLNYDDVMRTLKAVSEHRDRKQAAAPLVKPAAFPAIPVAVA